MHRRGTRTHGFTLIEVLIVLGLFALIAGLILSSGLRTHSGFTVKDDEDLAIATLQKARSQSMHGICEGSACVGALAHGVHVAPHALIIFQGSSFDASKSTNESMPAQSVATGFAGGDILFAPLSGNVQATGTIIIFDSGSTTAILTVGTGGQIIWNR